MRLLLAAALVLGSCGAAAGSGAPPTGSAVKVTMADDGATLPAHVGDHVQIALGETFRWTLEPPDGVVLTRPQTRSDTLVRGTQAIWLASSAGSGAIRATGTAACPTGAACPQFAVRFVAYVDVRP